MKVLRIVGFVLIAGSLFFAWRIMVEINMHRQYLNVHNLQGLQEHDAFLFLSTLLRGVVVAGALYAVVLVILRYKGHFRKKLLIAFVAMIIPHVIALAKTSDLMVKVLFFGGGMIEYALYLLLLVGGVSLVCLPKLKPSRLSELEKRITELENQQRH